MMERSKTIEVIKEKNSKIERILSSLKGQKVEVITLERPIFQIFEDLISELIIVLFPLELNKFNLEFNLPGTVIFYSTKGEPCIQE